MTDGDDHGRRWLEAGHRASVVGVYVLVLLVLQLFLLSVALDAFHGRDPGLAWNAAIVSVVLTASVAVIGRLLRR